MLTKWQWSPIEWLPAELDLSISSKTSKASKVRLPSNRDSDVLSTTKTKQNKPKRLSKTDLMEIINIKSIKAKLICSLLVLFSLKMDLIT